MIDLEKLYTIGEFAAKAGVTLRTLRYYDKIGLLKPCAYKESGHRLYSTEDFARLQKILTLKYIGLSLEEISDIIKYDINDMDFRKSLGLQRKIIDEKMRHMSLLINAIDETLHMVNNDNILNWDKFIHIINVLNMDNKWMEQYKNASNLRARINIHESFSTNKQGWMQWYFQQLNIPEKASILEVGCGDATLWNKNFQLIPESWDITLTDFSQGMLVDAQKALGKKASRFKFKTMDVQNIAYVDDSFDVVIANHMLYHVDDLNKAFSEISRVLKKTGILYASTVGKNHMKEMRDIIERFRSKDITSSCWNITEKFQLENGAAIVSNWFESVQLERYEDNLIVTKAAPLIEYIFSMPGNARKIFNEDKFKKLLYFIEEEIKKDKGIFITKDTGFLRSTIKKERR